MKLTKLYYIWPLILFLSVFSMFTQAAESPYQIVQKVGSQLFQQISVLSPEQRKDAKVMQAIIEHQLMPYVDYRFAAYKIMGKYVKKASKEQRKAFVKAMYHYLVNTYATALLKYKNQQVKYENEKPIGNKRIVTVRTQIIDGNVNAPVINLDFKLRQNKKSGEWKAFDMVVEGISLLGSKQAEIGGQIRKVGLQSTIEQLQSKQSQAKEA